MEQGSWPSPTEAKANNRWWETLLAAEAATCYLGMAHLQDAEIKSNPLV